MERKWIKTDEMLENLRQEPGVEQQYARHLRGILRSTHWLKYDGERDLYGDSVNISFDWFTRGEFLSLFGDGWGCREA